MSPALIIGYGNPLRSDDGLGWHAADLLRGSPAEVIAVHQLTPELAEPVGRAGFVIFIDAACDNREGVVVFRRIHPDCVPPAAFSHHFTPEVLLSFARKLYGQCPEAVLFSVGASTFECGEELSPVVQAALSGLLTQVQQAIHERGNLR